MSTNAFRADALAMLKRDIKKMDQEDVRHLSGFYPDLWHESAASMPDGWSSIIAEFFGDVANIGDLLDAVGCRLERSPSGLKVFCFPENVSWSEQQLDELYKAQRTLYQLSQVTCEWCGQPGASVQLGDRATFFLCDEHKTSAQEKLRAQIEAFDERVRFRGEVSVLFQKHSNVWLSCSDHNTPILRRALLDIRKIVETRDLTGKVHVTKVTESEGQLFVSVRYDPAVDVATRYDVDDIVHHAQRLSDEASLKANRGGADDDA